MGGDICGYDLGFTNNEDSEYWKENTNPNAPSLFDDIWSDAKNKTQWKKRSFYKLKKYTWLELNEWIKNTSVRNTKKY